jgi:hypothetical protein
VARHRRQPHPPRPAVSLSRFHRGQSRVRGQADPERRAGRGPSTGSRAAAIAPSHCGRRPPMAIALNVCRRNDPLDANYTQSQVIGIAAEVRHVSREAAGSGCAAALLYFRAVPQSASPAATAPPCSRTSRAGTGPAAARTIMEWATCRLQGRATTLITPSPPRPGSARVGSGQALVTVVAVAAAARHARPSGGQPGGSYGHRMCLLEADGFTKGR